MSGKKAKSNEETPQKDQVPPEELLPIQKELLDELGRIIRVRSEGGEQEMTLGQAAVRKLLQTALSGSPHALGHVMRQTQKAQAVVAKQVAESVATGKRCLAAAQALLEKWVETGRDPKLFMPHPDDIIVTKGVGWKTIGPFDQESLEDTLKRCAERDAFYMQAMLEERLASREEWRKAGDDHAALPGSLAYFMVHLIDNTMPSRFRLTNNDIYRLDDVCRRMTKRELLAHMYAHWRAIGRHLPRGKRFPTLKAIMPAFNATAATVKLMNAREKAGRPMAVEEIARELTARL